MSQRITDKTRRDAEQTVEASYQTADAEMRMQIAAFEGTVARLDAFLALKGEARAAAWRQASTEARRELVIAQGQRKGKFVCESWIAEAIETWNTKWAVEASTLDAATTGAFDTAAEEIERAARYVAGELAAIDNDRRALEGARRLVAAGVRPEQLPGGMWRVRSERPSGGVYQVNQWGACTCPDAMHRHRRCKHAMLVSIVERAIEARDSHDDYTPDDDYARAARKALGMRIVRARAQYVEAV